MSADDIIEVEVFGATARRYAFPRGVVFVGRAPQNDLVVADTRVSAQHVVLWAEADGLWVRDLGSANGTWINENRVRGPERVPPGAVIRLGPECRVAARLLGKQVTSGFRRVALQDARGARFPILRDRFTIGGAQDCDLMVAGAPPRVATILVFPSGELVLGTPEGETSLQLGEAFRLLGVDYALVALPDSVQTTVTQPPVTYPYGLDVRLSRDGTPVATLVDHENARRIVVHHPQQSALLHLLALRARPQGGAQGGADIDGARGWCPEHDLVAALWGDRPPAGALRHLLRELRADLAREGLDPWFIERRGGEVRARLESVNIVESGVT